MRQRPRIIGGLAIGLAAWTVICTNAGMPGDREALAATPAPGPEPDAAIYRRACASCHGGDGRGLTADQVGFDVPVPDFSDCSFATREPDSDWAAVIAEGGPARAFDPMMPAFGETLSSLEREQVLRHVRTFCPERAWPRGDLNLPRALVTEKAFIEDEVLFITTIGTARPVAVSNKLFLEKRVSSRGQLEVILPFTLGETSTGGYLGGLGDVALGTKWVLLSSLRTGSILSLGGEVVLPTGNASRGLGRGVTFLEPFLAFGQVLPGDAFVQVHAGAELSTEPDQAPHEAFLRTAFGITFQQGTYGRSWTPMCEVLGGYEFEDGQKTQWDLVPGLQVSLSTRQHVLLAAGVRIPVTDVDVRKPGVMLYLLWDWFDGGFTEGW